MQRFSGFDLSFYEATTLSKTGVTFDVDIILLIMSGMLKSNIITPTFTSCLTVQPFCLVNKQLLVEGAQTIS